MRSSHNTLASPINSAQLCRMNEWGRGTFLWEWEAPGDRPPACIRITARGDGEILAVDVDPLTAEDLSVESLYDLSHRDWRALPPPPPWPTPKESPSQQESTDPQPVTTDDARCNPTPQPSQRLA